MSDLNVNRSAPTSVEAGSNQASKTVTKFPWETPKLEDVSEQVMAQPYIRLS